MRGVKGSGKPIVTTAKLKSLCSLCLFLPSGRTFTFRDVIITCDNETVLAFCYTAMSDNLHKHFTGQKSMIVGWTKTSPV